MDKKLNSLIETESSLYERALNQYAIVAKTNKSGVIVFVNDKFCEISGYSREELLGKTHQVVNSGYHDKDFFMQMWATILAGKTWRGEIRNRAKGGRFYWVDTTITPIKNAAGEITEFLSIRTDITKQKEAQRISEEVQRIASVGGWELDVATMKTTWTDEVYHLHELALGTELTAEQAIEFYAPRERARLSKLVGDCITQGLPYDSDFEFYTAKGKKRWIQTTGRPEFNHEGKVIRLVGTFQDVTDRKSIDLERSDLIEKVSETNKYLDLAVEGANLGIWDWYLTDNRVKYNETWAKLRGVELSDLKMDLSDWESRVHPEDLPHAYSAIRDYLEGKSSYFESIHRVRHKNGKWIYIMGRGRFSSWDAAGKPTRFTGTDMDVTDLISAQMQLDLFFKNAPYGFVFWSMEGRFLETNDKMSEITGYSKVELLGLTYAAITPEEFWEQDKRVFAQILKDKSYGAYRKSYRRKDGVIVPVEITAFMVESYNDEKGIWAIIEDVSAKVRLEQEMKKREELTLLISEVRSKFIELSTDKKKFFDYLLSVTLKITQSEYGFLGEILEDQTGRYLKTFSLTDISWNQETRDFYQQNAPNGLEFRNLKTLFGQVLKTGEILIANDAPHHPKAGGIPSGHPPLNSFMGIPIIYNGKAFAMVGVANKPRGYQMEDYHYMRPFFDLIGEMIQSMKLSQDLEMQRKIAMHNSKLASIGELAAGVGHEINNPLAILHGHLDMMQDYLKSHNLKIDEIETRIGKSYKSIDRIANIVRGLRAFARADESQVSKLNLAELLTETKEMLSEIYGKEGITLEFDFPAELWMSGNRGRLQQVLVNILNNAKDAVKESVVKWISVKAQLRETKILLTITDSGRGVPDAIKDKIFDPFFTTKAVNQGTGIGLAIVSSIVKEHGGVISVTNASQGGAIFTITLESFAHAVIEPKAEASTNRERTFSGKVVVVDDEVEIRDILKFLLQKQGFSVTVFKDGREAYDYLRTSADQVDLVLSDIKMPNMTGVELAQALKDEASYRGRFVLVTGGVNAAPDEFKQLSDGVLMKPFTKESILNLIGQWF